MQHHKEFSPSRLPAMAKCRLFEGSEEVGEAAIRGTEQHLALSAALGGTLLVEACTTLDQEEADAVQYAYSYIKSVCGDSYSIDTRITVVNDDFSELTYGTSDVISVKNLFDYKSGEIRDYSAQMAAYALGMCQMFGFDEVICHVVYGKKRYTQTYSFTAAEAKQVVMSIVNAPKTHTPCDYCSWCKHTLTCNALNQRAIAVQSGREDWQLSQYHSSQITDPVEMSKALDLAKHLSKWCDAVEHHAKNMILSGTQIPGWSIDDRSGKRSVSDIQQAFLLSGMPAEKFIKACTLSLPKLEKEYEGTKKELQEKLQPVLEIGETVKILKKGGTV